MGVEEEEKTRVLKNGEITISGVSDLWENKS